MPVSERKPSMGETEQHPSYTMHQETKAETKAVSLSSMSMFLLTLHTFSTYVHLDS